MVRPSQTVAPLLLVVSFALLWAACDALSLSGPATYTGTVLDASSDDPIAGALVSAEGTDAATTTDDDGTFSLTVEADSSGQEVVLTVSADGYDSRDIVVESEVDETVSLGTIRLDASGSGGSGGGTGSGSNRAPESITLAARSSETIAVVGAGADETATLEFLVLDPSGRPVTADNAVQLVFTIGNGPGGGETLEPDTASTGSNGRADVTLTSGTRAGTVQVVATATVDDRTIRSQPVTVTITGGLPDGDHFSVGAEQSNVAGYNVLGVETGITAYVGDKYGNPVQPGTAVYFTTDGGIVEGSGITSALGAASVTLVSAAPRARNAYSCSVPTDPTGYTLITASTSDENNETVEASTTVLYTGETEIEVAPPAGGYVLGEYALTVSDTFGHPLAPGTSISVTAGGTNVQANGDVAVELGDFLCPGPGRTSFRFSVSEADAESDEETQLDVVTVTVSSPNGSLQFTGGGTAARVVETVTKLDD